MLDNQIVEWVVGGLVALVAWLGKMQINSLQKRINDQESKIEHIKETYFKKEDFKEFKQELWTRMDKMEIAMEAKIDTVIRAYRLSDFQDRG
jgi:uncharacterized membrane protein YhiD involved in acid resistance